MEPNTLDVGAAPPLIEPQYGRRRTQWRRDALRGRILVVYWRAFVQASGDPCRPHHGAVPVVAIARELGVSRQAVYRACPELSGRRAC